MEKYKIASQPNQETVKISAPQPAPQPTHVQIPIQRWQTILLLLTLLNDYVNQTSSIMITK